jgi:hypothetical protein
MYAKHDGSCNNFQIEFLQDNFKYRYLFSATLDNAVNAKMSLRRT